jgi:ribonuclease HI
VVEEPALIPELGVDPTDEEPALFPELGVDPTDEEPALFPELGVDPTDEEQVVALERSLLSDEVRADPASVAALLHPDWEEIGVSGRVWGREERLGVIGPIDSVGLELLSASRVADDAILLVWRGTTDEGSTVRCSLWLRTASGWRQRFHQGTPEF